MSGGYVMICSGLPGDSLVTRLRDAGFRAELDASLNLATGGEFVDHGVLVPVEEAAAATDCLKRAANALPPSATIALESQCSDASLRRSLVDRLGKGEGSQSGSR